MSLLANPLLHAAYSVLAMSGFGNLQLQIVIGIQSHTHLYATVKFLKILLEHFNNLCQNLDKCKKGSSYHISKEHNSTKLKNYIKIWLWKCIASTYWSGSRSYAKLGWLCQKRSFICYTLICLTFMVTS